MVRHTPPFGLPSPRGDVAVAVWMSVCLCKHLSAIVLRSHPLLERGARRAGCVALLETNLFARKCIPLPKTRPVAGIALFRHRFIALIFTTCTARCTVYVQYMYSMCTLPKRTNTVHILYIYCTTGREGVLNIYGLAVYEGCCFVVRHTVSSCAAVARGVPFSGVWGCRRRRLGPIVPDFSLLRLFFALAKINGAVLRSQ